MGEELQRKDEGLAFEREKLWQVRVVWRAFWCEIQWNFTRSPEPLVKPACFPIVGKLDLFYRECDKVLHPTKRWERVRGQRWPWVTSPIWVTNNWVPCEVSFVPTGNYSLKTRKRLVYGQKCIPQINLMQKQWSALLNTEISLHTQDDV